jgi:hypothetical protein
MGDYSPTSRPLSRMKILHALVGYMAVTGFSSAFSLVCVPLAAIDYDGYVNKTHIDGAFLKHVLDSAVETCQTVSTQNHRDSDPMKPAS